MRWATPVAIAVLAVTLGFGLGGCSDLRDFRGAWDGPRVGDSPLVQVGVGQSASAALLVEDIDAHGMSGHLTIDGLVANAPVASIPGAEADALAGMTFSGSPLRVYLSFVPIADGRGDALALIALYDHQRIEVRILRGGSSPLYAIFALAESVP